MKEFTKKEAVSIIVSSAKKYKNELEGRNLLFLCIDKHNKVFVQEVSFDDNNFLHLTGVNTSLSPVMFYERCTNQKLSLADFEFDEDKFAFLKLEALPIMVSKNLSAKMIGDYDTYNPKLKTDKLAGNVNAIMGFVEKDETPNVFIPNTVLKSDIRNYSKSTLRIIATFRKNITEDKYQELTYKANKVEWEKLKFPEQYEYLVTLL